MDQQVLDQHVIFFYFLYPLHKVIKNSISYLITAKYYFCNVIDVGFATQYMQQLLNNNNN